jgi:hypothetical protein
MFTFAYNYMLINEQWIGELERSGCGVISGFKPEFALEGEGGEKHGNPQSGWSPYRGSSLEHEGYAAGTPTTGLRHLVAGVQHDVFITDNNLSLSAGINTEPHLMVAQDCWREIPGTEVRNKVKGQFFTAVYTTQKRAHSRVSLSSFKAYLFMCLFPYLFLLLLSLAPYCLISPSLLFISPSLLLISPCNYA